MLKQLSGFRFGLFQLLLGLYLVLMVVAHFNYSSVQSLFPALNVLFTDGNTETWIGRLWLDAFIPFAFLWFVLEFIWPYAVLLYLFWFSARAWKTGFIRSLRWTIILRIPLLTILIISALAVILGRSEELKRFVNPSGEVNLTVTLITTICILLNVVANKLEERISSKTSLSTENT